MLLLGYSGDLGAACSFPCLHLLPGGVLPNDAHPCFALSISAFGLTVSSYVCTALQFVCIELWALVARPGGFSTVPPPFIIVLQRYYLLFFYYYYFACYLVASVGHGHALGCVLSYIILLFCALFLWLLATCIIIYFCAPIVHH